MPGDGLLSGAGRPDAAVFVLPVGEVMAVCTYDNPATMNRECWENKKLLDLIGDELMRRGDAALEVAQAIAAMEYKGESQ